jgi:hypothetical protein
MQRERIKKQKAEDKKKRKLDRKQASENRGGPDWVEDPVSADADARDDTRSPDAASPDAAV